MKKVIPVRFLIDDLNDTLFIGNPQPEADLQYAVTKLLEAAYMEYFLSIPNLQERDYYNETLDHLDDQLAAVFSDEWYSDLYEYCERYLASMFKRWDYVTMTIRDGIIKFISRGDYRIYAYNKEFGMGRVGDRICDVEVKPAVADDLEDPFYVSDIIPIESNEDAFNVTKTPLAGTFSEFKDHIRLERDGTAFAELRGRSRSDLLKAQALAAEPYPGVPSRERRAVVPIKPD